MKGRHVEYITIHSKPSGFICLFIRGNIKNLFPFMVYIDAVISRDLSLLTEVLDELGTTFICFRGLVNIERCVECLILQGG